MIPLTRNESGPQQREIEGSDDSSESFSEDCSDLKNMTPRTKDDVMPAGGKRLRCDSSFRAESTPDDFQLDYDRAKDRITVTSTMNTAYRTHRNRMFQHYLVFNSKEEALEHLYPEMNKEEWTRVCDLFASEEFQRRSAINKENRAKLKIVHTSKARSFQRARALLVRKMEGVQLQHESEGKSYIEVEIFTEVLGMKVGYVRGLGRYGADQIEYEALLVKRSDMEQTMREHQQMMEDQL
ncbi:hypothetical protein CJ030_MR6G001834 [Morella rubra]|uniref:Uncharacterized protein n=1 Tax=Morella rubra TaxID=262757 RepID=A0A6A1VD53_9ROSI|nr:hypothetical protein CJ030_MR6G001834 [Morella rubra]